MAVEAIQGVVFARNGTGDAEHVCRLPWPKDPSLSEGHLCECGRRWSYLPAHWAPLLTIEELREQQRTAAYARGCI